MHTHYRTQGFFFKRENRVEADQVFSVFTKDFGRVEIVGKAIRKINSKLRSSADIFYLSEIEFIQGKAYKTLTDALAIDKFRNVLSNEQKFKTAIVLVDVFDCLVVKEENDLKIWKLLLAVFQELNRAAFSETIYHYFVWNLFSLLGYKPELYFCPLCRKKLLPETFYLSAQDGGIVCWQCFAKVKYELDNQAKAIKVDTVKALRFFLENPIKTLPKVKIEKENLEDLAKTTAFYFDFLKSEFSKPEKSDIIAV